MPTTRNDSLDALRALGALLVFSIHTNWLVAGKFDAGWTGVSLFFALSGYLIGGRLLELADREIPLRASLSSFYWRRVVRIFPVYILFLSVVSAFAMARDSQGLAEWLPYAWTYTSNFFFASSPLSPNPILAPTWSLAVEEQFYLLFPLVVLLLGRRRLFVALIAMIVAGPVLRIAAAVAIDHWPRLSADAPTSIYVLGFTQVDAFAFGALVNLLPRAWCQRLGRIGCIAPTILMAMAIGGLATGSFRGAFFLGLPAEAGGQLVWAYTLVNIVSMMLICRAVSRPDSVLGVATAPLARVGRWSYSFYLIHLPVLCAFAAIPPALGIQVPGWLGLPLAFLATLAIARLLYETVEKPAQGLRTLFDRPTRMAVNTSR